MKHIGDIEKLDLETAQIFSNNGIDVFNAADDFFNDICHPFENPYNKDITINDRRNNIYQNVTFCQNGCKYNGVNYSLSYVNCLCNSSYLQEEKNDINIINTNIEFINFKVLGKVFIENLLKFNFRIIRCYNLILNIKNLIPNIGFYCISSMFLMQIIFLFIYLAKKLKKLKKFMIKFQINQNKNYNQDNDNKKFVKKEEGFKKNRKNERCDYDLLNFNINSKKEIKYNNNDKIHNKKFKKQRFNKKYKDNIRNTNKMETLKKMNNNSIKSKINKKNKIESSNSNIQEFDFEQAIIYDKRSYLKMYWGFLSDSQIILKVLCTDNNLDLFAIKLSLIFN